MDKELTKNLLKLMTKELFNNSEETYKFVEKLFDTHHKVKKTKEFVELINEYKKFVSDLFENNKQLKFTCGILEKFYYLTYNDNEALYNNYRVGGLDFEKASFEHLKNFHEIFLKKYKCFREETTNIINPYMKIECENIILEIDNILTIEGNPLKRILEFKFDY